MANVTSISECRIVKFNVVGGRCFHSGQSYLSPLSFSFSLLVNNLLYVSTCFYRCSAWSLGGFIGNEMKFYDRFDSTLGYHFSKIEESYFVCGSIACQTE